MTQNYKHTTQVHNQKSASEIVPFIISSFNPKSVVDVGCGTGSWLLEFLNRNIVDVIGVDGEYVNKNQLVIPCENFLSMDLTNPTHIERKFDLAISLEVAEHLPESAADTFVDFLTSLSDVIVFSAAIVNQGGQNHFNEQPLNYWNKKMRKKGYEAFDIIRFKFWDNKKVDCWYSQNSIVYCKSSSLKSINYLSKITPSVEIQTFVHPKLYEARVNILKHWSNQIASKMDLLDNLRPASISLKKLIWLMIKTVKRKLHSNS